MKSLLTATLAAALAWPCLAGERKFKPIHRDTPFTVRQLSDLQHLFKECPEGTYNLHEVIGTFWGAKLAWQTATNKKLTVQWHAVTDLLFLHSSDPEMSTMVNPQLQGIAMQRYLETYEKAAEIKNGDTGWLKELKKKQFFEKYSLADILKALERL